MLTVTAAQITEWRRAIAQDGALHPALASRIVPRLLDEIEHVWALLERAERERAALEAAGGEDRFATAAAGRRAGPPRRPGGR